MTPLPIPTALLMLSLGLAPIEGPPGANKPPALHVFGGQPASINLAVSGINLTEPLEIRAELYQKGQSLLAPLQKEIQVAPAFRYGDCFRTGGTPACLPLLQWEVPMPKVKNETQLLARLRTRTGNGQWLPAGQLAFTVYPGDLAKTPLRALARERGMHLFGESQPLRAFLQTQEAAFELVGGGLAALPADGGNGIYLGQCGAGELAAWLAANPSWRGCLVVFCPDAPLLPGVFTTVRGGARVAKVTLPLLDTLSTDPRSQKTFLEILNTVQNL